MLVLLCINGGRHCTNIPKVVIKTLQLQGSVVTQTVLDGLTIYHPVTNFLQCIIICRQLWMLVFS